MILPELSLASRALRRLRRQLRLRNVHLREVSEDELDLVRVRFQHLLQHGLRARAEGTLEIRELHDRDGGRRRALDRRARNHEVFGRRNGRRELDLHPGLCSEPLQELPGGLLFPLLLEVAFERFLGRRLGCRYGRLALAIERIDLLRRHPNVRHDLGLPQALDGDPTPGRLLLDQLVVDELLELVALQFVTLLGGAIAPGAEGPVEGVRRDDVAVHLGYHLLLGPWRRGQPRLTGNEKYRHRDSENAGATAQFPGATSDLHRPAQPRPDSSVRRFKAPRGRGFAARPRCSRSFRSPPRPAARCRREGSAAFSGCC